MKKILVAFFVSCVALIGCNNNQERIEELSLLKAIAESNKGIKTETLYASQKIIDRGEEAIDTNSLNELINGTWAYQKSITTVDDVSMDLVVFDNWVLDFDGKNCRDIEDGNEAQANPYLIRNDSLIFTNLKSRSMKIVSISDTQLQLGQDEYTVLIFNNSN